MTYEEIYKILYVCVPNEKDMEEARHEIAHFTDEEWHNWIEYKNSMQGIYF
jgi:hypothetical protein